MPQSSGVSPSSCGDGANQHPSQTLLDLYAIRKTQGTLYDKTIALVGDLKYGRTVHSLIVGMAPFRPRFIFVSPPELMMPEECKDFCRRAGIPFTETTDFTPEVIRSIDVLYMTRVQRERFIDLEEYERVKNVYVLTASMLEGCENTCVSFIPYLVSARSLKMWTIRPMPIM